MFKYLWIILLLIPYLIWTGFSVYDVYLNLKLEFEHREIIDASDCFLDLEDPTIIWLIVHGVVLIAVGILSFIMFLGGFES